MDPEDAETSQDFEWTEDLSTIRNTTCLPSDDENDGRTSAMTRHLCKKSSFTLDGSAPFDFGLKEKDVHKSPYLPSRTSLHIENAPSFTLDMLDENDPFESWDTGSRDSMHYDLEVMERKMSISMDIGKRKRWRTGGSKLRLSDISSTLEIQLNRVRDTNGCRQLNSGSEEEQEDSR